jgi:predicted  nucleic acid-binding Zn-ribbon protein
LHPQVKKLLDVQKVDQRIRSLRKDIDTLPEETARRQKTLDQKAAALTEREKGQQEAELRGRSIDLATRQADEELKKLEARLNLVKNNAEYQATLLQIESVRRERDRLQEEGFAILDRIETLQAEVAEARRLVQAETAVFEGFSAEARKLRAERESAIAEVMKGRAVLLEGIPRELMERYDTLFRTREGLAVCAVEAQVCQGCYTNVTMNDIARLKGGSSVVGCGSCNRILYLPDQ